MFESEIVDEFGEFIHWNRITKVNVENSFLGFSKIVVIQTKDRERKRIFNLPHRVYIKKSESVEITTFIVEKANLI